MELYRVELSLINNSVHINSWQGQRFAVFQGMRHKGKLLPNVSQNIFYVPALSTREKSMLTYKNVILLHI